MDQQRLGINLVSLIATLRDGARLPIGAIQNGICAPSMGCASAREPSWLQRIAPRKGPRPQWTGSWPKSALAHTNA